MFKYAQFILFLETIGYKCVYINKPMNKANWCEPHINILQLIDCHALPHEVIITLYANSTGLLCPVLITWTKMTDGATVDLFKYEDYNDAMARLTTLAERG